MTCPKTLSSNGQLSFHMVISYLSMFWEHFEVGFNMRKEKRLHLFCHSCFYAFPCFFPVRMSMLCNSSHTYNSLWLNAQFMRISNLLNYVKNELIIWIVFLCTTLLCGLAFPFWSLRCVTLTPDWQTKMGLTLWCVMDNLGLLARQRWS